MKFISGGRKYTTLQRANKLEENTFMCMRYRKYFEKMRFDHSILWTLDLVFFFWHISDKKRKNLDF